MHNYIEVIKTAIIYFPPIAFLFTIPFILHNYHKYGSISILKTIIIYSFIFYLMCAYFLVILPLPTIEYVSKLTTPRIQLIPLKFIYDIIRDCKILITNSKSIINILYKPSFYVSLYNIFLTIPFAVYIRYYFNTSLKKTLLYTFLLSLFFELTQLSGLYFIYPRSYRLCDIDDLIQNTLGGLIGYYLSLYLLKYIPHPSQINKNALDKGIKEVSGFRKVTSLILDIFIVSVITTILLLITNYSFINDLLLFSIILLIYIFIIPSLLKGRTISEIFLNLLVVDTNNNKINLVKTNIRRLLFVLFYIIIPTLIIFIFIIFNELFTTRNKILIILILSVIYLFYYSISIIKYIFINKPMLYEKLSNTKYISTLKEKTSK